MILEKSMNLNMIESFCFRAEDSGYYVDRMIVVVEGVPFYRSSGLNSMLSGTFLPFLGVGIQDEDGKYGWLRKPGFIAELSKIHQAFNEDEAVLKASLSRDGLMRFATLKCLLLSSVLDEALESLLPLATLPQPSSFWHTPEGITLNQYLKKKYAKFYATYSYSLVDRGKVIDISSDEYGSFNWRKGLMQLNGLLEEKTGKSFSLYFSPEKFMRDLIRFRYTFEQEPHLIPYTGLNEHRGKLFRVNELKKRFHDSHLQAASSWATSLFEKKYYQITVPAESAESSPEQLIPYLAKNYASFDLKAKAKYMLGLLKALKSIHQGAELRKGLLSSKSIKAFHGAIQPDNVFYDSSSDKVYITGCFDRWPNVAHSRAYIPPEIAAVLVMDPKASFLRTEDILRFKKDEGQATDVWSMALIFACLLSKPCINEADAEKNHVPPFYFLHHRLYALNQGNRYYLEMSSLTQEEIDMEMEEILSHLPPESKMLSSLWSIVMAMLKVEPKERASVSSLIQGLESMIEEEFYNEYSIFCREKERAPSPKRLSFFAQLPVDVNSSAILPLPALRSF